MRVVCVWRRHVWYMFPRLLDYLAPLVLISGLCLKGVLPFTNFRAVHRLSRVRPMFVVASARAPLQRCLAPHFSFASTPPAPVNDSAFLTAAAATSYQDAPALDMQGNDGKNNQRASSPTKFPASFAKQYRNWKLDVFLLRHFGCEQPKRHGSQTCLISRQTYPQRVPQKEAAKCCRPPTLRRRPEAASLCGWAWQVCQYQFKLVLVNLGS